MFRNNKSSVAIKYAVACGALLIMGILSVIILKKGDTKIQQKEETLRLDIQGKVNICLPDEK